jgi:HEAT repeat protein
LVPLSQPTGPGSAPDGYTKDAVDALNQALDSTQAIIRFRAATALSWIGTPARTAVPKLIARIDDRQSYEIRKAVAVALGTAARDELGWPIPQALEALGRAACDQTSRDVRISALQSIISLGPPYGGGPTQVGGVLKQRLNSERDKSVVIWVRVALMRLDPSALTDASVQVISKQLVAKPGVNLETRVQAAKALGYMASAAKPGVSDMMEALQSSDQDVLTAQICWSLARMGQYAERALPALRQLEAAQKDAKDAYIRDSARVAAETIEKAVQQQRAAPPPMPPAPAKP